MIGKTSIVILICLHIAYGRNNCGAGCTACRLFLHTGIRACYKCSTGYSLKDYRYCKKVDDSGGCFPGNAMVATSTGNVAMETLNIGDSVLTEIDNNQLAFTKVMGFAQREPGTKGHYLSITAVNQAGRTQTIKLTATHNIYVKTQIADDPDEYIPKFAEDVLIGDMLKIQTDNGTALNEATVTHVTLHKEMGVYNPLTETGTMLVDGTLVSCYASFNHYGSHLLMAPIRWFPWLFAEERPLGGKLPYVEDVKHIFHNYVAPLITLK